MTNPYTQQPPVPVVRKRRRWPWVVFGAPALFIIIIVASRGNATPTSSSSPTYTPPAASPPVVAAPYVEPAEAAPPVQAAPAPAGTVSQRNAVRSAESYVSYQAFSRTGLIKQLVYEKYSTADATYAVDHITVDWMEQAAKSAKSYLEFSAFSKDGLIKQLKYEGFTTEQAAHGVASVGL